MNRITSSCIFLMGVLLSPIITNAQKGPTPNRTKNDNSSYRTSCTESRAQTDLAINNVRARLRAGGDMWWDGTQPQYIVPNVDPASGEPEIVSLYSGAIWLGAYDDGGNLILAAQTYRSSGNDYWTGPLDPDLGTIDKTDCERWDLHFTVYGDDIDALRADYLDPLSPGVQNTPSRGLLGWPGKGNPHFLTINGFDIREYDQDLAPFIDANSDGIYNPYDGDHPIIEVSGCENYTYNNPVYADQMTWWVYNDNGNLHTQTNGQPMKMEIQATAFGYRTTDAINNQTFYRYKLLNRNKLALNDTYFSLWTDPDLGCRSDDYIGCDTVTGMGYVYNADANDDNPCAGLAGYGTDIPALGVDYFRGPLDSAGNQIGLSSFQYHIISTTDPKGIPSSAIGYYRLISGFWPNGTPITAGGNGYDPSNTTAPPTPYVFPSFPNESGGGAWSMCSEALNGLDQAFLHTSGPFVLKPGATNEMISGVVWVPSIPDYPCPSLRPLVAADILAQNLFDNCFKITDGPDAPYIDVIEMDEELVLNLYYSAEQNNFKLGYEESPAELRIFSPLDTTYNFQGYKVYQVNDPNLSVTELDDETKARLIFQTDVNDGVSKIANWEKFADEDLGIDVSVPTIQVEGEDKGIKHTFKVVEDQFAEGEKGLVNHKPYYFCVVAYAHNEYQKFDPVANAGQAKPYLQGRRNFRIYTAVPRINDSEYSGIAIQSAYGDRPGISRLDGSGVGSKQFLEITNLGSIENAIVNGENVGKIDYAAGNAPIDIKIVDPLRVAGGTYQLHVCDKNYTWTKDSVTGVYQANKGNYSALTDSIYWVLTDVDDPQVLWSSFQTMDWDYEQYIPDLGISVSIQQVASPSAQGEDAIGNNTGWIGSGIIYSDSVTHGKWYKGLEDGEGIYNMIKNGPGEDDELFDPNKEFSTSEGGWYPFMLCDGDLRTTSYYFSLMNIGSSGARFRNKNSNIGGKVRDTMLMALNNVNVVFTADESKWSRCIVTETFNRYHGSGYLGATAPSDRRQMEWRGSASAGKPVYYSRNKDMSIDNSSVGMSWFPGYAYDVETGERLNIFFGENSLYNGVMIEEHIVPGVSTGNDMIFNPTSTEKAGGFSLDENVQFLRSVLGGQHIIYVTRTPYDSCQSILDQYNGILPLFTPDNKLVPGMDITWASMALLSPGASMGGSHGHIPPTEATVKLRVNSPYEIEQGTYDNLGYPLYEFSLAGFEPTKEEADVAKSALDLMRVVPNPYYAYSDYEITEVDNVVKITNIPAKCNIRIYSLDGRFVREFKIAQQYRRDLDRGGARNGIARVGLGQNGPEAEDQITTSIDWDLKNYASVPVAGGVYLIHIKVDGVGTKVLKSFIINRAFDAQRL
ncbi:hypothetical protein [Aureispira anguillae]|uniref:T9SS C-terminal target domain-containing protein n=1 Tax=Aureispira anguillae TaxID=2864201 RepID=A0A915YLI8_9BACT|nr:hypothetical protein [Aureispira anguillae]BDS15434.1 hypothetical protein AsAng_0062180 [Aureispira anguillae]